MSTENNFENHGPIRGWEYSRLGDYHRNLDPNWSYKPTYLRKMSVVRFRLDRLPRANRVLDVGCGEGVLVEEMRHAGLDIEGIDLNYRSAHVTQGDILALPHPDGHFNAVVLLDVFEHLAFADQPRALAEIRRVLKPSGLFIASIPNLAHLNSRVSMFVRGRLDRSDSETNHVGERPCYENARLLREAGFAIDGITGITFTVPCLYRRLICRYPTRLQWLHDSLEPLARLAPSLALLNVFFCRPAPSSAPA